MAGTLVRATVKIDGNPISYSRLSLRQQINWHHSFSIYIPFDARGGLLTEKAEQYVNKTITIGMQIFPDKSYLRSALPVTDYFVGTVTGIALSRGGIKENELILKGQSPTISMDDGPNTRSFTEKSLKQIIDEVASEYQSKLGVKEAPSIEPAFTETIPYLVQYKESDYEFLYRLAARYGEWMYYDGMKFYYGKPKGGSQAVPLTYGGNDLLNFELGLNTIPINFKLMSYDYLKHDFPEDETPYGGSLGSYGDIALNKSKGGLYVGTPLSPVIQTMDQEKLKFLVKRRQEIHASDMIRLRGVSRNPALKIGGSIQINDPKFNKEGYGEYIVTSLVHDIVTDSDYVNRFEAVPKEMEAPPFGNYVKPPFCETQVAEITDVNDSEGYGRVRVKFMWQRETEEKSPWIRVASPFTGKDKGFYVIPEIEDLVLVDFEHHNPDKPYVLSGFYHGKAKPEYQHPENYIKALKTTSGNQIYFSDEGGKETIKINNPDFQNEIILELGDKPIIRIKTEGDMFIEAKDDITMTATNITINASNALTTNGKTITSTAKKDHTLKGNNVKVESTKDTSINATGKVSVESVMDTSVTAMMIKLNS